MNKKYTVLAVLIVLALALSWLARKPDSTNFSEQENGTRTYFSTEFNFSFSYPDYYFLEERDVETPFVLSLTLTEDTEENRQIREGTAPPREGPTSITLEVFENSQNKALNTWIMEESRSNWQLGTHELLSVNVPQRETLKYRWSGLYEGETYAFSKDNKIYLFSVTWLDPTDQIVDDFELMLYSFHFE